MPRNAWGWCWLGRACAGIGEVSEARSAYAKAIELERSGGERTGARELLGELNRKG